MNLKFHLNLLLIGDYRYDELEVLVEPDCRYTEHEVSVDPVTDTED
jgi:hypothetical protein